MTYYDLAAVKELNIYNNVHFNLIYIYSMNIYCEINAAYKT